MDRRGGEAAAPQLRAVICLPAAAQISPNPGFAPQRASEVASPAEYAMYGIQADVIGYTRGDKCGGGVVVHTSTCYIEEDVLSNALVCARIRGDAHGKL